MIKNENFIVIQGFMINELKLKGNELLVYAIIHGFSQTEEQKFTGSLQYLADWTNSTKQGVIKNLKSLIEKGYILKIEKYKNNIKYCEYKAIKENENFFVYRFLDESNNVLYVGKTQYLSLRMETHFSENSHLNNELYKKLYKIEYVKCANCSEMNFLEGNLIKKYKTINQCEYNKKMEKINENYNIDLLNWQTYLMLTNETKKELIPKLYI